MTKFWGLIGLFFVMNSSVLAHEFYLSIAKVEYNEKTNSFEVAIKLTAHDFEAVLEDIGVGNLHLGEENESPKADAYIYKYVLSHFQIKVNGFRPTPELLGKEINNADELWLYLEYPRAKDEAVEEVEIINTMMIDQFPKQQNHHHLKIKGDSFALVCTKQRTSGTIYTVKKNDD